MLLDKLVQGILFKKIIRSVTFTQVFKYNANDQSEDPHINIHDIRIDELNYLKIKTFETKQA